MKTALAVGIGCDRGTPYATVAEVIDQALFALGARWADVRALASIDLKADEASLHELMRVRQMPIRFFTAAQLADVPVPNPSETVRKYTGTPSVSEAAALLAAGQGTQSLASFTLETGSIVMADTQAAGAATSEQPAHDGSARQGGPHVCRTDARQPRVHAAADLPKPAPMSALLIEKLKLRGPDGRNATVSVARIV